MKIVCPHCLAVNNVPKKDFYKKANCGKCKNSLLDTKPMELNDSTFDTVVANNEIPVIVDFWAPWCGPCQMMAPNFERAAQEFPLKARFAKVNTEEAPNVSARFGIRSIPTIIVFKDGREVDRVSGALDANSLASLAAKWAN
jgi:thioredoxin 2